MTESMGSQWASRLANIVGIYALKGTHCIARDTSSLARTESELSSAKGTIINQLMKFVL